MDNVIFVDLKSAKIRACTARRADGTHLTIINARIAQNAVYEAYTHELRHIRGNDFDKADANRAEMNAHEREQNAR